MKKKEIAARLAGVEHRLENLDDVNFQAELAEENHSLRSQLKTAKKLIAITLGLFVAHCINRRL